jgi:putative N-acetyltransferase (TIGR04045 family)
MAPESIDVHWMGDAAEFAGAVAVREQVFCEEQGVPREDELDGRDEQAAHVVAVETGAGRVIGTTRLLVSGSDARVGRVAVERDWRRRGIASRMLELALAGARERGCVSARLAAQMQATALYQQAGFAIDSEPFEEAGIAHVWMSRSLTPGD